MSAEARSALRSLVRSSSKSPSFEGFHFRNQKVERCDDAFCLLFASCPFTESSLRLYALGDLLFQITASYCVKGMELAANAPPITSFVLREVELAVLDTLHSMVSRDYGRFRCERAVLYLSDKYSQFLEPLFAIPTISFEDRIPIPSSSAPKSFLATISFNQNRNIYSLDPDKDNRLSDAAKLLIRRLGIRGSIICCPIACRDSNQREVFPIGILVLCADRILDPPDPEHEVRTYLASDIQKLGTLLIHRNNLFVSEFAGHYEELIDVILKNLILILGTQEVDDLFTSFCAKYLRAKCRFFYGPSETLPPNTVDGYRTALELIEILGTKDCRVFNGAQQEPLTYERLSHLWPGSDQGAFMLFRFNFDNPPRICLLQRDLGNINDRWSEHDVILLKRSARLFNLLSKRSRDFVLMLDHLREAQDTETAYAPFSKTQFAFIYYIFKEFLNVDQLLMTKVTRESKGYLIEGVFASGFGTADNWLIKATKRHLATDVKNDRGKLDVLPHILRSFLRSNESLRKGPPPVFVGTIGDPKCEFFINKEVIKTCNLKGKIYFLPCFTVESDGKRTLRSILHLGRANGGLELRPGAETLLVQVARSVAEALGMREKDSVANVLQTIRSHNGAKIADLDRICRSVKTMCRSVGATIFVRATLLPILGIHEVNKHLVLQAFVRFFNRLTDPEFRRFERDSIKRAIGMFCAYFGVRTKELWRLLDTPIAQDLAAAIARSLYVRVGQSDVATERLLFANVFNAATNADDVSFYRQFAVFIKSHCYLPGYGLTGWVLRYRINMLLSFTTRHCIREFFRNQENKMEINNLKPLIEQLRASHISSRLLIQPVQMPHHAQHICDSISLEDPQNDTYLACLFEDVDDPRFPAGLIRTSTSAGFRSSFAKSDKEALGSVAMHISGLIRRDFVRQQLFIRENSDVNKLEQYVNHKVKRFGLALQGIRDAVGSRKLGIKSIAPELDELEVIHQHFLRYQNVRIALSDLSYLDETDLTCEAVESIFRKMIAHHTESHPIDFVRSSRGHVDCLDKNLKSKLFALGLVLEEILSNSIRHSRYKIHDFRVVTELAKALKLSITENPIHKARLKAKGRAYAGLLKTRGEGAKLLDDARSEHAITVTFSEYLNGNKQYAISCPL